MESRAAVGASTRSVATESVSVNMRRSEPAVSATKPVEVSPPAPVPMYVPFYRYGDSAENMQSIIESGELRGNNAKNTHSSPFPAVRSYGSDWLPSDRVIEFYTPVRPDPRHNPARPTWTEGAPGVTTRNGQAVIPCTVACVGRKPL